MKYKAFTLVELIVVISILGILSTVGFISYMGYSENSRDSARISNLTKLEKTLEIRKTRAGEYPKPDESSDITYMGKTIWTQGIIGSKTKKYLKFQADGMDPKYETDYSYSVTANGDRFEIGTIMENEENNSLGFLLGETYAAGDDKALNHGNFKGKFYSTKINGETHIFSIPGLILSDKKNFDLKVDVATDRFSITGESTLPESYSGVTDSATGSTTSFTPRLLYKGPNCGVETDQEIVNFIATLRDSFNSEPYLSNSKYKNVFKDYEYLKSDIINFGTPTGDSIDFEKISTMGLKINESLGCHIKNFKTTDIFPTKCGDEGLNFEGVEDGYDIATKSCLFSYTGDGDAIVKDSLGTSNTKGLHLGGLPSHGDGVFKYRFFSYKSFKFNFDLKTNLSSNSYVKLKINDSDYLYLKGNSANFNSGYQKYTTPLLKPGLYEFEIEIDRYYGYTSEAWIDNIDFTCIGGGGLCGWNGNGFENGSSNPWDLFSFEGEVESTWIQSTSDVTEGNFSLTNPKIPVKHGYADLVLNKKFDTHQKLSFDLKTNLNSWSNVVFFINDIEYKFYSGNGSSDNIHESNQGNNNSGHLKFTTPLLPAGDYEFRWRVHQRYWNTAYLTLDNIEYLCVGGIGTGCGWGEGSLDEGDKLPWEVFDFEGEVTIPWNQVSGAGDTTEGSSAIKNPTIPGATGKADLVMNKTFDKPQKLSFDLKSELMHWSNITFYINGVEYMFYSGNGSSDNIHESSQGNLNGAYKTYTTPLLPAGEYEFKWRVYKRYGVQAYAWIDNIQYSCIDNIGVNCGVEANTLEQGDSKPWDLFKFTGDITTPWNHKTGEGNVSGADNTYAFKNPTIPGSYGFANLTMDKTLSTPQKISFDIKTELMHWSNVTFLINDVEYLFYSGNGSTDGKRESGHGNANSGFQKFESPLLPAGDYEFKWIVNKRYGVQAYMWLDNIEFTCNGPGATCGWEENTFEDGINDPSGPLYNFTGSILTPWRQVEGGANITQGNYAIKSPTLPYNTKAYLEKTYTLTSPKKFSFDIRNEMTSSSYVKFYVDNVLHTTLNGTNSYQTITTDTLSSGSHTFKWEVRRYNSYISYIWLDNFNFLN